MTRRFGTYTSSLSILKLFVMHQRGPRAGIRTKDTAFKQISSDAEGIITGQFAATRTQGPHPQRVGGCGTLEQSRLANAARPFDQAYLPAAASRRG